MKGAKKDILNKEQKNDRICVLEFLSPMFSGRCMLICDEMNDFLKNGTGIKL